MSTSRKGNCYYNAPVERCFRTLKSEMVQHQQSRDQAEALQVLGYRNPEEFERQESGA